MGRSTGLEMRSTSSRAAPSHAPGASAPGKEAIVRMHQRKVEHYGTGPCAKYDASCAERTSSLLLWCEDQFAQEHMDDLARCPGDGDRQACEEAARRAYRDQVLTCVGG